MNHFTEHLETHLETQKELQILTCLSSTKVLASLESCLNGCALSNMCMNQATCMHACMHMKPCGSAQCQRNI